MEARSSGGEQVPLPPREAMAGILRLQKAKLPPDKQLTEEDITDCLEFVFSDSKVPLISEGGARASKAMLTAYVSSFNIGVTPPSEKYTVHEQLLFTKVFSFDGWPQSLAAVIAQENQAELSTEKNLELNASFTSILNKLYARIVSPPNPAPETS